MSPPPRVVVLGDLMVDVVATATVPLARGSDAAATVRTHGGGSAANVAAWLADAGVPVLLVCRVGDDAAGRGAIADLEAGGVTLQAATDPDLPTGTCVVVVEPDGERTFLPDRGANTALAPGAIAPAALRRGDHLHVSGYALLDRGPARAAALDALARAREVGATSSVDPASSAPLRRIGAARFLAWVAGVGTLLPNGAEAIALTGEGDPERAALALARRSHAEVVATLGAAGALWTDGTRVVRQAGEPVPHPDTTGAGDAFAAGWLAARLAGADVPAALRAANALGARAVAAPGARPGRASSNAETAGASLASPMRSFLHVARAEDWEAARAGGAYAVPAGPDPFIHACFPEQLPGVLERFYAGTPRDELVLLEVEPEGLPVRVEPAADGAGDFPHVHGPIPLANVTRTRAVP